MSKTNYIQPFDENIVPWERGVRLGGTMNKEAMHKNLLDFKEVLDKYKVSFVLIFGALLGLVRENKLIDYDTDIDVACFDELTSKDHWNLKNIKKDLREKGFYVVSSDVCYLHSDFFIRNGEKIEIWWFDKIDDEWIFGNTVRYPSYYFDKLEEIDFLKTKFKVPNTPQKFLEYTYGKDWKIPLIGKKHLPMNPSEARRRNEKI